MTRPRVDNREVLAALFDFSFSSFVAPKLVRYAYMIVLTGAGFLAVLSVVLGFTGGAVTGGAAVIGASVGFLFSIRLARIGLEAAAMFFRLASNSDEVAEQAAQIEVNTRRTPRGVDPA